jgi:CRISPR/Cas system-associated exonuclease Cas4 (RecB family)
MDLSGKIYGYFEREENGKPRKGVSFSPTSAFDCARRLYFKFHNVRVTDPPSPANRVKMHMGELVHGGLQKLLKQMFRMVECEKNNTAYVKIDLDTMEFVIKKGWFNALLFSTGHLIGYLKFRYRVDAILESQGEREVIEIKTVYMSGFNSVENAPKTEHVRQLVMYMLFKGLSSGKLWYIGRDNGYMKIYDVKLDDKKAYVNGAPFPEADVTTIANAISRLYMHLDPDLPEDEFRKEYQIYLKGNKDNVATSFVKDGKKYASDWQCMYCPYLHYCWATEFGKFRRADKTIFYPPNL